MIEVSEVPLQKSLKKNHAAQGAWKSSLPEATGTVTEPTKPQTGEHRINNTQHDAYVTLLIYVNSWCLVIAEITVMH